MYLTPLLSVIASSQMRLFVLQCVEEADPQPESEDKINGDPTPFSKPRDAV